MTRFTIQDLTPHVLLRASFGGRMAERFEPGRLRRAFAAFVILIGLALFANLRPA